MINDTLYINLIFILFSMGVSCSDLKSSEIHDINKVERMAIKEPIGCVLIPSGLLEKRANGTPWHIKVSAFYIGKCEVTKGEWDSVRVWGASNGYTDLKEGFGKGLDHPVLSISWLDAIKWCNARSEMEGRTPVYTTNGIVLKKGDGVPCVNLKANGYRLPTEVEWVRAASGGKEGTRYPWGDTITHKQANYFSSPEFSYDLSTTSGYHPSYQDESDCYTAPVGSFSPNGYGLYDVVGNVSEMCWDWFADDYEFNRMKDPQGPKSGRGRVIRGGSYNGCASGIGLDMRGSIVPTNSISMIIGFRVAASQPQKVDDKKNSHKR